MTVILSLDLSGQTGWAMWREGLPAPLYGVAKLPKGSPGQTYVAFRDWLTGKVVGDAVEHLVVESTFIGEKTMSAAPRLYALRGIAQEIAYRKGLSINADVTVDQWRKHFVGQAKAPRTLIDKAKRRAWLKQQARDACERRGWPVRNDDEADALGLLVYERARLIPSYGCEGDLFGACA